MFFEPLLGFVCDTGPWDTSNEAPWLYRSPDRQIFCPQSCNFFAVPFGGPLTVREPLRGHAGEVSCNQGVLNILFLLQNAMDKVLDTNSKGVQRYRMVMGRSRL